MTTYRVYLLDDAGNIRSVRMMELADDAVALVEACVLLRESGTSGVAEVRDGDRIVGLSRCMKSAGVDAPL
jgi:hypothetical protein